MTVPRRPFLHVRSVTLAEIVCEYREALERADVERAAVAKAVKATLADDAAARAAQLPRARALPRRRRKRAAR